MQVAPSVRQTTRKGVAMSQKSNARESQRGGISHHEMKRGSNNWQGGASFKGAHRKSQEGIGKNEELLQPLTPPELGNSRPAPIFHVPLTLENRPKKPAKALVM
jgi:hypothetical protein